MVVVVVTVKKCTTKLDARAELLFELIPLTLNLLFFAVCVVSWLLKFPDN